MIGDLDGSSEPVWYTPKGIANVLSLASVRKHFAVEYRPRLESAKFVVHMNRRSVDFVESDEGLYYFDTSAIKKTHGETLVTTVEDQRQSFTNREYFTVKLAREL